MSKQAITASIYVNVQYIRLFIEFKHNAFSSSALRIIIFPSILTLPDCDVHYSSLFSFLGGEKKKKSEIIPIISDFGNQTILYTHEDDLKTIDNY